MEQTKDPVPVYKSITYSALAVLVANGKLDDEKHEKIKDIVQELAVVSDGFRKKTKEVDEILFTETALQYQRI